MSLSLAPGALKPLPGPQALRLSLVLLPPLVAYYAILVTAGVSGKMPVLDWLSPLCALWFFLAYRAAVQRHENRTPSEIAPFSLRGALAGAGLALLGVLLLAGALELIALWVLHLPAGAPDFSSLNWEELLRSRAVSMMVAAKEEFLFRALLLRWLMTLMPFPAALVLQALLFGGEHWVFGPMAMLNAALAGIVLGLLYARTNNLWLALGFHFAWDFFVLLLNGGLARYQASLSTAAMQEWSALSAATLVAGQCALIGLAWWMTRTPGRLLRE